MSCPFFLPPGTKVVSSLRVWTLCSAPFDALSESAKLDDYVSLFPNFVSQESRSKSGIASLFFVSQNEIEGCGSQKVPQHIEAKFVASKLVWKSWVIYRHTTFTLIL